MVAGECANWKAEVLLGNVLHGLHLSTRVKHWEHMPPCSWLFRGMVKEIRPLRLIPNKKATWIRKLYVYARLGDANSLRGFC